MDAKEAAKRMHTGELYFWNDEGLMAQQLAALEMLYEFNQTRPSEMPKRQQMLKQMFAEIGENCYIEPPFHANWSGKHVHFGNNVYANFNLTLVDDTHIYIGNNVMMGPNVTLCTATHPISPRLRNKQAQYNLPITIEDNVWLGGGVFVMPGITIGKNSVVGANSVVTKDIPENVVAVGNPCRVLRPITEEDEKFYRKTMPIDIE